MSFAPFEHVWRGAMSLLPTRMDSPNAKAMVYAICLQESRFEHRRQINGPARGFPQFELAGIRGVLRHPATEDYIHQALNALVYDYEPLTSYTAIEHNDILACCYARLNLWWLQDPLPNQMEPDEAWSQYLATWRPGKPHRQSWDAFYNRAWQLVLENT